MSARGQVVIPEEVRRRLGLKAGDRFVVVAEGDVVVLKAITTPSLDEFSTMISEARRQARQAGMKRSGVKAAVARVRRRG